MSFMTVRYSAQETARRGDEIYERAIRSHVETAHYGKVVAIDIDTESYIIADNALAASERLLKQYPKAEIWCVRVGHHALHRIDEYSVQRWRNSILC